MSYLEQHASVIASYLILPQVLNCSKFLYELWQSKYNMNCIKDLDLLNYIIFK